MILFDAYALVALLGAERAARSVVDLMEERGGAIASVNLAETIDVLARIHGVAAGRTRSLVEAAVGRGLTIVAFEARHAWRAGELRAEHYHRSRQPLSLGDCAVLAVADVEAVPLATSDAPILAVAKAERIEAIRLPSRDRR